MDKYFNIFPHVNRYQTLIPKNSGAALSVPIMAITHHEC